jgi:hypothetical protein
MSQTKACIRVALRSATKRATISPAKNTPNPLYLFANIHLQELLSKLGKAVVSAWEFLFYLNVPG